MQNKLDELWALLNFLMPGIFGDAEDFKTWFTAPLEVGLHETSHPWMQIAIYDTSTTTDFQIKALIVV